MSDEIKSTLREVLKDEFAAFHKQLAELQKDFGEFRGQTEKSLKKLKNTFESLEDRVKSIEKNQEETRKVFDKIEHDHDRRDRKLSSMIVQYQHLETFIGNEIKKLANVQDKQKTIDLLSARSIQHEAEIRDLNRMVRN